jgi:hypothetical protein
MGVIRVIAEPPLRPHSGYLRHDETLNIVTVVVALNVIAFVTGDARLIDSLTVINSLVFS